MNKELFYVSTQGQDRWSGRLSNPSSDGKDGPFATVGRARDALRALRKKGALRGPVRIQIRGGTYFLPQTLVFASQDSGTPKFPVIFEAFEGERPVLSGGRRIDGWKEGTVHGKACWTASIPEAAAGKWTFTQLFVNGVRRPRTRLPKEGYYRFTGMPEDVVCSGKWFEGPDAALFAGKEIQAWKNLDDVRIVMPHFWFETHHRIRAVDEARQRVSFCARSIGPNFQDEKLAGAYLRYHVENVFEALDTPGEWYLDRPAGLLFYLPMPGETVETAEVIAPKESCLLQFEGTDRKPVNHIRCENIAFYHAEWEYPPNDPGAVQSAFTVPAAVVFDRAEDCVLYACEIAHIAQYGVEMKPGCSGNRVVACTIRDMGAGGVKIGHDWLDRTNETSHRPIKRRPSAKPMAAVVSDCSIHDGGLIYLSAIGIWIGNSAHNRIRHNNIFNLNYTGISCGWTWGYAPTATVDNRIENNRIHHINWNRVLSDNGGIYMLGIQPGTIIRGNHIHHVGYYGYGGWGIYPDEGSSEMLVEGNLVHHTEGAGFSTHYGRDNVVRNNIFAFTGKPYINPMARRERHRSTVFERNIVCWSGGGFPLQEWRPGHFIFRDNLFWNGNGRLEMGNGTTMKDWQGVGQHLGSVIADPLFVDADAGDFTLRADSPALRVGFKPLKMKAGPRFKGSYPVSFADWPEDKEERRPIVRTHLDLAGPCTLRVKIENVGNAPASGRLAIRATPSEGAALDRKAIFAFQGLRPGASESTQFPIEITPAAERVLVETLPAGDDIVPALQFLVTRDPEWRIPRIGALPSAQAVRTVLAEQSPRCLTILGRTIMELRAAVTDGSLAFSARIVDAEPSHADSRKGKKLWDGSCIELFTHDQDIQSDKQSTQKGNAISAGSARQSFLVPAVGDAPAKGCYQDGDEVRSAPEIAVDSVLTPDGYAIAALWPLALLKIAPASRRFGLELVLWTTPSKESGIMRIQFFGAPLPMSVRDGCAAVIVE